MSDRQRTGRPRRAAVTLFAAAAALAAALALAPAAGAQEVPVLRDDEELDFDRPEAWAMKYFAMVSMASGFGVPAARRPGEVDFAFEVDWIPEVDEEDSRVGFRGTKEEDLNKAPLLARPRITFGLPASWSLELGWVPPVEVFDAKPNLVTAALGRPLFQGVAWRTGLRLHGMAGTIESDITCPNEVAAAGDDLERNPFACEEPSNDEVDLAYYGVELTAERDGGGAWVPYAGVGIGELDMELQVDAFYNRLHDLSLLTTSGSQWHGVAGLRWEGHERAGVGFEVFYSPLEVERVEGAGSETDELLNVRALVSYRVR